MKARNGPCLGENLPFQTASVRPNPSESALEVTTTTQRARSIAKERVSAEDLLTVMAENFKQLSATIEENRRVP